MPYALCPMPYAVRVPHMRARKAIVLLRIGLYPKIN